MAILTVLRGKAHECLSDCSHFKAGEEGLVSKCQELVDRTEQLEKQRAAIHEVSKGYEQLVLLTFQCLFSEDEQQRSATRSNR